MIRALVVVMLVLGAQAAAQERVAVDLELVLMADASGSIDEDEIRFQREGYAEAMADPQVLWAIRNGGALGKIAVAYVEWANPTSHDVVVDWMVIEDAASAAVFGEQLVAAPRRTIGSNAIGVAVLEGLEQLETNNFEGWRRVIDLSGDSAWNPYPPTIEGARDVAVAAGVTVNGLAVLCRGCSGRPLGYDLEQAFREQLIGGAGAFVVTADGRDTFARAVRRKLILEIAALEQPVR